MFSFGLIPSFHFSRREKGMKKKKIVQKNYFQ
jgi:hypothetical protein